MKSPYMLCILHDSRRDNTFNHVTSKTYISILLSFLFDMDYESYIIKKNMSLKSDFKILNMQKHVHISNSFYKIHFISD
jgi:hypothetical protein